MYLPTKELPVTTAPKRKARRKRLSWKQLDACESARDIAALLTAHGIKGKMGERESCPLARATGWSVGTMEAWDYRDRLRFLTLAEIRFVDRFDAAKYPQLIDD